jgi:putative transposase
MREKTDLSQRRACLLVGLSHSTLSYSPKRPEMDSDIKQRLTELAQDRRRFGYCRLHAILRREGLTLITSAFIGFKFKVSRDWP